MKIIDQFFHAVRYEVNQMHPTQKLTTKTKREEKDGWLLDLQDQTNDNFNETKLF